MKQRSQDEIIKMAAEAGAKVALETVEAERKRAQKEVADRRLRNTKLLLRNYRMFKAHAENAVYEAKSLRETAYDILEDMSGDGNLFVESIKTSVARTATIVRHIDVMLQLYRTYCNQSGNPEEERRCRVVNALYIAENPCTVQELAALEGVVPRTIYRDADIACERIAALIFGIDGIRKAP